MTTDETTSEDVASEEGFSAATTASIDVAVIGRGMIGSAAARHLAESGVSTALIGPGEPEDRRTSDGPFSSHPDEGRITRLAGRTPVWAQLAQRSIGRYRDIEERSGIAFHTRSGLALVMPDRLLGEWIDNGLIYGSNVRKVDGGWLRERAGIAVDERLTVAFEGGSAGHINPRRLVAAQTELARMAGATVIDDAAVAGVSGSAADGFEVTGSFGSLSARRVLVATGAFGRELVPIELELQRAPRTVVQAELAAVGEGSPIPSLITIPAPDDRLDGIYWVPPVRYPDGRVCLKIGGEIIEGRTASTAEELVEWFHGDGDPDEIDALQACIRSLLPDAEVVSFTSTPCVVTRTPSDYPLIDWVDDGLAVAVGGNGSAAKSSDELGRLAATLFSDDGWTDSIPRSTFALSTGG